MRRYNIVLHFKVEEYLRKINDKKESSKILQCIGLIEEKGLELPLGLCKKINKHLWELRISYMKKEHRLIFTIENNTFIFLHAFIKKSMKIPLKEIHIANKRRAEI